MTAEDTLHPKYLSDGEGESGQAGGELSTLLRRCITGQPLEKRVTLRKVGMEQRCPKRKLGRVGRQRRAHQRLRAQDNESSEYSQKLWSHTKRKLDFEENCLADDKRDSNVMGFEQSIGQDESNDQATTLTLPRFWSLPGLEHL